MFFNNFDTNIEKASEISRKLILVGDLNEDLLNRNYHNLRDILLINSMQNVISDVTRQNAILDPIIIFDDMPYIDSGVIDTPNYISDHKSTYIILPFHYEIQNTYTRLVWLYKSANFETLKQDIIQYDWSCLHDGSLDEVYVKFTNIFLGMVKSNIPSKTVVVRPDDKPWYNHEIRHYSVKRDRVKNKLIKSGTNYLGKNIESSGIKSII